MNEFRFINDEKHSLLSKYQQYQRSDSFCANEVVLHKCMCKSREGKNKVQYREYWQYV